VAYRNKFVIIYEDRISREQFVGALEQFVSMPKEHWSMVGKAGRQHVIDNYNFSNFIRQWDEIFTEVHTKHGSWPNKAYKAWELKVL